MTMLKPKTVVVISFRLNLIF